MSDFSFDPDIAAMNLSDGEKSGLQIYRNYSQAFDESRAKIFADSSQTNPGIIDSLSTVLKLLAEEDSRTLPVIACAFADDQLKEMFRREIPEGVPGGRGELLSGFGPLARLSQRIQMAYAFGWLSKDALSELDHLRKMRNEISHKWNIEILETKVSEFIECRQHRIEQYLGDGIRLPTNFHESLDSLGKLRVRLVWLMGRVTYESQLWVPALKANLKPHTVLYGKNPPAMLSDVSAVCVGVTRKNILRLES